VVVDGKYILHLIFKREKCDSLLSHKILPPVKFCIFFTPKSFAPEARTPRSWLSSFFDPVYFLQCAPKLPVFTVTPYHASTGKISFRHAQPDPDGYLLFTRNKEAKDDGNIGICARKT
jgi:hypothetical protein